MSEWRGRLFLGRSSLLYAGPVAPTKSHRHHAFQILVCVRGEVTLTVEEGEGSTTTRAAVLDPGQKHAIREGAPSAILLYLDPDESQGRRLRQRRPTTADSEMLVHACPAALPETWADADAASSALLGALGVRDDVRPTHEAIESARRFIEANLHGDLRAPSVARRAGVSPRRLAQLFAAELGLPLRRYVRWARIRRAAAELELGASLTDSAAAAGFADAAHLTRTFREMFGIAPSTISAVARWVVR